MFNDGIVKLCDFGWCARLDGGQRITFCGTVEYMSPEMVNKEEYSKEIDIWSLGILLYEMTHGYSPFKPDKAKFNIYDVIDNIKIKDLKFANEISKECKELIIHLLDRDITKRYKVEDIFSSNFVNIMKIKIK
jgi:serine/threonine protein kinase